MSEFYYKKQKECQERRIDSDLPYAVDAMSNNGFQLEEVAYVLAEVMGENDGPSWHWLIAMKDHTYAYVSGWCDYSGWGCQDGGEAEIFPTLREAIKAIPETESQYDEKTQVRKYIEMQLTGKLAFGEVKQGATK